MTPRTIITVCTTLSAVALIGCPNAEGEFEAFQDRYDTIHPSTTGAGGSSACETVAKASELDGDYVFALSASLDPKSPVRFDAKVTTKQGAKGLELSLALQAIDACDRKTLVGEVFDLGPFDVAPNGSFTAQFPPLEVTGLANPFSENPITAEVSLTGSLCAEGDSICGALDGDVTKPTKISLTGSNFRFERLTSPGSYPTEVKVDCDGTLANEKLPPKCTK
ncbi:MAG: hypothetical protein FJ096_08890 [Deltaproteobacteria bacterium]|nr:hypothetical protein [Deltaproteobacteria bacterium]